LHFARSVFGVSYDYHNEQLIFPQTLVLAGCQFAMKKFKAAQDELIFCVFVVYLV